MREFIIGKNDAGQRLDRWLIKNFPALPPALLHKHIRLKRIKCNGKPIKAEQKLQLGDRLSLYVNDEFFELPAAERSYLLIKTPQLQLIYEDENLLLVDKQAGISVHPDESERVNTLITHIQAYLYQKQEWKPEEERSFAPALCNRLDRNTGGIVIAAKNAETLRRINRAIAQREIEKYYLCIILGKIEPPAGVLDDMLQRDRARKRVSVLKGPKAGGQHAAMEYRTLQSRNGLSLLECRLITGRTHQIRVQLAHAGHPLLGDQKYGSPQENQRYDRRHQALYSYKLRFSFSAQEGMLSYLNGKTFYVPKVDFAQEYFPHSQG